MNDDLNWFQRFVCWIIFDWPKWAQLLLFLAVTVPLSTALTVWSERDTARRRTAEAAREAEEAKPVWIQAPDGHWEQQIKQKPAEHDSSADAAIILWFLL